MTTFNDWRRQPFTGATYQVSKQEIHTIQFYDDWNAYGIQLSEGIYLENPSSVSIVENVTGGTTFSEVSRTTAPIAGQFRVDYEADTYTGTSRIEFNASDNGIEVVVNYKGLGLLASTDNYQNFLANKTVPDDFGVQTDFTVGNDLSVGNNANIDGDLSLQGNATIQGSQNLVGNLNIQGEIQDPSTADTVPINSNVDMNSKKITNLGTPTAGTDAVNIDYVNTRLQGTSVGAIGTYALLSNNSASTFNPGDTTSGTLVYASANAGISGTLAAGTWRCMGFSPSGLSSVTLWLRIS
jgi:hypothetical protein